MASLSGHNQKVDPHPQLDETSFAVEVALNAPSGVMRPANDPPMRLGQSDAGRRVNSAHHPEFFAF
jgi:hypothetical protein